MKLTLDELKVDSYATQVSESELTEVKGGTTPACALYAAGILIVGAATILVATYEAGNDHKECGKDVWTDENGVTHEKHVCAE